MIHDTLSQSSNYSFTTHWDLIFTFLKSLNNSSEEKILELLNPIINSKSEWRPQAIEILYEYFLSKGEDVKSQEYYQLLQTTNN